MADDRKLSGAEIRAERRQLRREVSALTRALARTARPFVRQVLRLEDRMKKLQRECSHERVERVKPNFTFTIFDQIDCLDCGLSRVVMD